MGILLLALSGFAGCAFLARPLVMAWALYNKLTDEDLGVIYDYLKMQNPVAGAVEKFPKSPKS